MTNQIVAEWLVLMDTDLREAWEERAAIMEFDGGLERDLAEALALLLIIREYPQVMFARLI
jgi:hypothetical protein